MPERGEVWLANLSPRRGTEPGECETHRGFAGVTPASNGRTATRGVFHWSLRRRRSVNREIPWTVFRSQALTDKKMLCADLPTALATAARRISTGPSCHRPHPAQAS